MISKKQAKTLNIYISNLELAANQRALSAHLNAETREEAEAILKDARKDVIRYINFLTEDNEK